MGDTTNATAAITRFTEDNIPRITAEICELIAVGYSLRAALEQKAEYPSYNTFYKWLDEFEHVRDKYARARELQQDFEADNMVDIADVAVDPNKARIQIDARKWRASKLAPKKYGDKLDLNHSGSISTLDEATVESRLAELFRKAGLAGADGAEGTDSGDDKA